VVLREAMSLEALLTFPLSDGMPMFPTFDSTGRRLAITSTGEDVALWDIQAMHDGLAEIGLAWDQPPRTIGSAPSAAHGDDHLQPAVAVLRRPGTVDRGALERASALVSSGVGAYRGGRRVEAIHDLRQASDQLRALMSNTSGNGMVARQLGISLGFLASALRDEHRPAEALAPLQEARQVLEAVREPSGLDLYNMACVYAGLSALSGPGSTSPTSAERATLSNRAMDALRRSLAAGMTDFALIDHDTDLEPLRDRTDFRELILDARFPRNPFVSR
jgi:hypothetical protein